MWQQVNACETVEDLKKCILDLADANGDIRGRTRYFDAKDMADNVDGVIDCVYPPNVLTREFGIRAQALYLREYNN